MPEIEIPFTQTVTVNTDDLLPGPQGPSGLGLPIGGTVGQVVKKKSLTDYDTEWANPSGIDINVLDFSTIQDAFNNAPIDCTLRFPSQGFTTTVPLVISRKMNIDFGKATITGNFSDTTKDTIVVDIPQTSPASDVRNYKISGGTIINNGGNSALNINSTGSNEQPSFELEICNGVYSGNLRGIRIGGANSAGDTNFNTIRQCHAIANASSGAVAGIDLDGCADGQRIRDCLIFGQGVSIRVNVVLGAFNTLITGNGLISNKGALSVVNGAKGIFHGNQCEQPAVSNTSGALVTIDGGTYIAHNWSIKYNNFGGGTNVGNNLSIANAQGTVIDENYFFPAINNDIIFSSAAKYNTVGGKNWMRGTRSTRVTGTDAGRRMIITDSGTGNRGIWRNDVTLSNNWVKSGFAFFVDDNGFIHFEGALDGGTSTNQTLMTTMPVSCRPREALFPLNINNNGTYGYTLHNPDGTINMGAGGLANPNQKTRFGHVTYPVDWHNVYDVGA